MNSKSYILKMLLLISCVLVSGCSFRKTILNNSSTLLYWELDDQFDFNSEQKPIVKKHIKESLKVIRIHFGPLNELVEKLYEDGLTEEDLGLFQQEYLLFFKNISMPLAQMWVETYSALTEQQIAQFEQNFETAERKAREKTLKQTSEDIASKRTEKILDLIEDWYGKPSQEQIQKITLIVTPPLDHRERWSQQRLNFNKNLVSFLRNQTLKADREKATQAIANYIANPQDLRDGEAYEYYQAKKFGFLTKWFAVDAFMQQEQRLHALKEFRVLKAEIQEASF